MRAIVYHYNCLRHCWHNQELIQGDRNEEEYVTWRRGFIVTRLHRHLIFLGRVITRTVERIVSHITCLVELETAYACLLCRQDYGWEDLDFSSLAGKHPLDISMLLTLKQMGYH